MSVPTPDNRPNPDPNDYSAPVFPASPESLAGDLTSVLWNTPDQWLGENTSGWISAAAPHWAIEPHLPANEVTVARWLDARGDDLGGGLRSDRSTHRPGNLPGDPPEDPPGALPGEFWVRFDRLVNHHLDTWCGRQHRITRREYHDWDPDRLTGMPEHFGPESSGPDHADPIDSRSDHSRRDHVASNDEPANTDSDSADHSLDSSKPVFDSLTRLAAAAGYKRLTDQEIRECVGVASTWGVPLSVDFDQFERLAVFARGDVIGHRFRRNWRRLYRREVIDVPVYQRMVVAFQLTSPQTISRTASESLSSRDVHLRLFKNIPKQDIDMLLPGGKVKITGVDRVKIILPSLGGFLLSLRKIAQFTILLAALALHWVAILVALVIGYAIKSGMSYFQTRNRYELNLTRNLYFQKLDTNAGVLATMVDDAVTQRRCEAMMAYHALATADETPISTRKLKRRCERYVREASGIEMDFQIARAITLLVDCDLAMSVDGRWMRRLPPPKSFVANDRGFLDRMDLGETDC